MIVLSSYTIIVLLYITVIEQVQFIFNYMYTLYTLIVNIRINDTSVNVVAIGTESRLMPLPCAEVGCRLLQLF